MAIVLRRPHHFLVYRDGSRRQPFRARELSTPVLDVGQAHLGVVAVRLGREQRKRRTSFKTVVNDVLRAGRGRLRPDEVLDNRPLTTALGGS